MRFTIAFGVAASLWSACVPSPEPVGRPQTADPFVGDATDAAEAALDFLATGDGHRLATTDEILLRDVSFDRLGRAHVRIQQTHSSVPVFGREAIVLSNGADSTEHIAFDDSLVRTHRWKVQRKSGTGSYTLCVQ